RVCRATRRRRRAGSAAASSRRRARASRSARSTTTRRTGAACTTRRRRPPWTASDRARGGAAARRRPRRHDSQLRQHGLGARLLQAGLVDEHLLDLAVVDDHAIALRALAHAEARGVELEAEGLRELAVAVGQHADLAAAALILAPRAHDEGIVHGDADDLLHALRLEIAGL